MITTALRVAFLLVLALGMVACESESKSESPAPIDPNAHEGNEWTHTILLETEYYTGGPQQGRPPDGQISAGTRVKIMEGAGSYALIKAETGETGYVSASALEGIE